MTTGFCKLPCRPVPKCLKCDCERAAVGTLEMGCKYPGWYSGEVRQNLKVAKQPILNWGLP